MLHKLSFPIFWKILISFSLVDFELSCLAFLNFFPADIEFFIELVHLDSWPILSNYQSPLDEETELITQTNKSQFNQHIIWWELQPFFNVCHNKVTKKVLSQEGPLYSGQFVYELPGLVSKKAVLFSLQHFHSELSEFLINVSEPELCFLQLSHKSSFQVKNIPHFGKSTSKFQ